ncbi:MAG: hypothetical protein RBR22_01340 [Desulfuromonas sp.]|nr:hypothetical protein [Desulfuromonas sp.]
MLELLNETKLQPASLMLTEDALRAQIDAAQVISFDFFDTLFVRPLADPEDLFDLIGQRFGISDFRQQRRAAQSAAFQLMHQSGRGEITLDSIYACLAPQPIAANTLQQAEYDMELAMVQPNPELEELYRAALASDKTVIIVSDMYLPEQFFCQALQSHQFHQVPLFISAAYNATKRDHGELFDHVANELGVAHQHILHIGDNLNSDVKQARRKGLQAYHYIEKTKPKVQSKESLSASLAQGLLRTVGRNFVPGSNQELGFLYGGPAAVGFLDWIADQAKNENVEHVLFLSRDGYVLDQMVKNGGGPDLPRCHYLLGSRVVFMLAAINISNFMDYIPELLAGAVGLSPFELLERIGVSVPESQVMADLGLDDNHRITLKDYYKLAKFLYAWRGQILQVCQKNRQALFSYLQLLGIQPRSRVALVDVGWNGTTQQAFEQAVQSLMELDVRGYYFCLADTPLRLQRQKTQKMSALYSSNTASAALISRIYANRVAVELFFSAPHDAVIGLQRTGEEVLAVEDPGRAPLGYLSGMVSELIDGMTTYAQGFYSQRKLLDLHLSARDEVWPLVDLVSTGKWQEFAIFSQVKNFDAWGSSRNRDMLMKDYYGSN